MPNIGFPELVIILLVVALLFGATRLPKLARSVGESAQEFRKGLEGKNDEDENDAKPEKSKRKEKVKSPAKADSDSADETDETDEEDK